MKRFLLAPLLLISIVTYCQENKQNNEPEKNTITIDKNSISPDDNTLIENNSTKINTKESPTICNEHIKIVQDPMTGDIFRTMKEVIILSKDNEKGFSISVSEVNRAPFISFKSLQDDCVKKYNHISIWFKDGTELRLSNVLEYNCEGKSTAYFGEQYNKFDKLEQLTKNRIAKIRLNSFNDYIQEDMDDENSLMLMTVLDCLYRGLPR